MKVPDALEWYDVLRQWREERRERRRTVNHAALKGVKIVRRFTDEHYRIKVAGREVDFWPSSGRWRAVRDHRGETGRGGIPAILRHFKGD